MEVLLQLVSYIGTGVSLMSGSIPGVANTIKAYTQLAGRAAGWLVWLQAYCGLLYKAIDFNRNWFPRGQNITEYVINLGMRKFPSNSRNNT